MTQFESVSRLKTREVLDISTLPDGIVAIFTGSLDSKLATQALNDIEEYYPEFKNINLSVFFATRDEVDTFSHGVLYDPKSEISNQCKVLCKKNEQCEALLYFKKEGDQIHHLYTRESPQVKYQWVKEVINFAKNFMNADPDKNNLWRFGQIVEKPGEYLCVDCGYIETFEKGDIYPVCEVCLSGDPEGPTDGPDQGYWEYLA